MIDRVRDHFRVLLPAYMNGTLGSVDRLLCGVWLRLDASGPVELTKLQRLQRGVQSQVSHEPPARLLASIQLQIRSEDSLAIEHKDLDLGLRSHGRLAWAVPILFAVVALGVIWYALPPAISLEWSVLGEAPSEFRVYRARVNGDGQMATTEFQFLEQVPAADPGQPYTFSDLQLLPGQRYLYRVEAVSQSGQVVKSNTTLADSISALPGQVALLLALLILAYGFYALAGRGRGPSVLGSGGQNMVF